MVLVLDCTYPTLEALSAALATTENGDTLYRNRLYRPDELMAMQNAGDLIIGDE